jgi:Tfp pilus assembly protein PilV
MMKTAFCERRRVRASASGLLRGFTLVEVMIASGILFLCLFAILGLLANLLRNARTLQRASANDAGTVASYFSSLTNRHEEGIESGTFSDLGEFSDKYHDFRWTRESTMWDTNGCWYEVYTVRRAGKHDPDSVVEVTEWDPASTKAAAPKP